MTLARRAAHLAWALLLVAAAVVVPAGIAAARWVERVAASRGRAWGVG